ncbi:hypothetical protein V8J88_15470 [Massilia sp. W12]
MRAFSPHANAFKADMRFAAAPAGVTGIQLRCFASLQTRHMIQART